jgi:hypothetical protein
MSTTTSPMTASRPKLVPMRIGLGLSALLSAMQIQTGVGLARNEGEVLMPAILIGSALTALVALGFAWRGQRPARVVNAAATVAPTLLGISAFFHPELPAGILAVVSLGILLALVSAALVLLPRQPGNSPRLRNA